MLSEEKPNFNELVDPKCDWALRHLDQFPVEVQTASYAMLLRVPGIGPKSAGRINICKTLRQAGFPFLEEDGCRVEAGTIFHYLRWQADVSHADRGRVYHKAVDRYRSEGYMQRRTRE